MLPSSVCLRATVLAFLCVIALLALLGCERQVAPPLVEVTELTPRVVEVGDRLELHGTGFPQGRTGRVTLEGTVSRPGEPPMRGVTFDVEGTVITPDRVEVVVRDALAERLCGRGDRAAHATFRGDVEVAFASNNAGAPPLVGVLHGAVLDVMPSSARASVLEARVAEGDKVLAFLGVVPAAPTPRGLPVEQVRAGSPAARAGIQVGDVIVSVDGVHVLSLGDVLASSARSVELTIRHADSGVEETKTISILEYAGERVPTEYGPALVVVGLALAILLLLVLPGPPSLASLELQIASRLRRTTLRALLGALVGSGREAALSALGSAVIAAFSLTSYVVGREVDGVVMLAVGTILLVWSRLAGARGPLAALKTLLCIAPAIAAIVATIALAVAQVGAIELAEIARVQGGAPWQFSGARHPSCAVLVLVYAVAIVAVLRTQVDGARSAPHAPLLQRGGLLGLAALGVATFFGGWQLPGMIDARGHGLALAAAASYVLKTWVFAALLLGVSRVTARLTPRELPSLFLKRLLPALVLSAGIVALSRRLIPSVALETAFGATLVAVVVLFAARLAARVRLALDRPEPHASPFL